MPNPMKGVDEYVSQYGTADQQAQYQRALQSQQQAATTQQQRGTHQPTHSPRIDQTTGTQSQGGGYSGRSGSFGGAAVPHNYTFDESTIADAKPRSPSGASTGALAGVQIGSQTPTALRQTTTAPYSPTGGGGGSGGAAGEATSFESQESIPWAEADRVGHVSTDDKESILQQLRAAQEQQSQQRIDRAVQQGVDQLTRAQEDAASQYQTMRDQIATDEARALDNQVLYAEARGDRGGIGAAQYGAIQNTAATNQLTVNKEQTKLATDTARQIADLRAQGEFQKADELLSLTQSYMSQLMQLKQWADQMNISVDEFNVGVQQWEQEYNMKVRQTLAEAAQQMIAAGAAPTEQQLQALGWTPKQYDAYKYAQQQAAAKSSGSKSDSLDNIVKRLMAGNVKSDIIRTFITNNTALYGENAAEIATATLDNSIKKYGYQGENDYDYGG